MKKKKHEACFSHSSSPNQELENDVDKGVPSMMGKVQSVFHTVSDDERSLVCDALNKEELDFDSKTSTNAEVSSKIGRDKMNSNTVGFHSDTSETTSTINNSNAVLETKTKKKLKQKKIIPEGWPKQPLSAYNFFFKEERLRILGESESKTETKTNENAFIQMGEGQETVAGAKRKRGRPRGPKYRQRRPRHGQISFHDLAKNIGAKWKSLSPENVVKYNNMASRDRLRYDKEVSEYHREHETKKRKMSLR